LQEAFDRHGLDMTKEQMVILKKLHEQDGINQNELASLTYRDKSSLARLISKMESKKYIRRVQSKEDKRNNEIFITEEGLKILAETRPVIQEVIDVMEQGINKEDKALIINTLKKVQNNFNLKSI
jgi:DNA-binding MarR family transcriptional regulator